MSSEDLDIDVDINADADVEIDTDINILIINKDKKDNKDNKDNKDKLIKSFNEMNINDNDNKEENKDYGLNHWLDQNNKWKINHISYTEDENILKDRRNIRISKMININESQYYDIYLSLCKGKKFINPVPLSLVTEVLVHGWKKDGFFSPETGLGADYPKN